MVKPPHPLDRLPPHSIDAEQGLLSSMLQGAPIDEVTGEVTAEAFYDLRHRSVFGAIVELWDQRAPVDVLSLSDRLRAQGRLDEVGGQQYLSSLMEASPSASNWPYWAGIVNDHATCRRAIQVGLSIVDTAYESTGPGTTALVDTIEKSLLTISPKNHTKNQRPIRELIHSAITRIEEAHSKPGIQGLGTGFPDLDQMTQGMRPGNYWVIAGRPSVGKTTLAMNILEHATVDLGQPAGMFSLEMTDDELAFRLLCSRSRVVLSHMQEGFLCERDFPKLTGAAGKISKAPIYIDDTPGLTLSQLRSRARRWIQAHSIKLLVIDYLQLLHTVKERENRQREVAEISTGIKELAKELGIPAVVVSQLNRASAKEDRQPRLEDLRESGAIEQDADLVGLLYRQGNDDEDPDRDVLPVDLRIAKQRNGPTGTVHLTFFKSISRFESAAKVADEDVPSVRQGQNIP